MKILFMPSGKYYSGDGKILISDAAQKAGIPLNTICGGKGVCKKCTVRVNGKNVLACKTYAYADITVEIPQSSVLDKASGLPEGFKAKQDGKYRISFDIGTTTVAASLWKGGSLIDTASALNPQSAYGADIMSRIQFCVENDVKILQSKIIECINSITDGFIDKNNIDNIDEILMVGNTAMSHILLGINPKPLSHYPFKPSFEGMKNIQSDKLNINAKCNVCILPNVACHVGSDITADMLAVDIKNLRGRTIIADIGTNGEIVFADNGELSVCSTAAGPAFEGANIRFGMRAARGAIEGISISDDISLDVIGNVRPTGICGSGLIDIIAKLYEIGIIDKSGRIIERQSAQQNGLGRLSRRIINTPNGNNFIIAYENDDIILTQNDVREFQLAKAAVCAGIKTLLNERGYNVNDIDRIFAAGSFGSHINVESAVKTGLLPDIDSKKIKPIGNAAAMGANMALLSEEMREKTLTILKNVKHIELSENEYFQNEYINCMNLG